MILFLDDSGRHNGKSACALVNRNTDLWPCLTSIRQMSESSSHFWFGDSHSTRCPPALAFTIDCFSPHTTVKTLSSLVFRVDNTDLSAIDR